MVRMVPTNHFCEMSLQRSDPTIELLTKTHFIKNDNVQILGSAVLGRNKNPAGYHLSKTRDLNPSWNIPESNGKTVI